jgi:cytochrome c-type biogenesis protein CcmF
MLAVIGYGALLISFIISLYAIFAAIYGELKKQSRWVDSARRAMLLTFPVITVSAISMIILLVSGHYEVAYVAKVTSDSMPAYLKITAFWGGQAGSLLFWSWLMSAFASLVMLRKWDRDREFLPWVIVVTMITLAFFLSLSVFFENPFVRTWWTATGPMVKQVFQPAGGLMYDPGQGSGLNPLLRHFGMVIHPPMLYLGFVSFVIPFAFAIASLITNRSDDRWIKITRRWTLWAWLFLSMGLILGGRWAYDVLGWGGYWAWDPVEVAALLPWLACTPFLHSVMIQEKRGMMKHWNMFLIILTYGMMVLGTFLTRSGAVTSVHSFTQSQIGPYFFIFLLISVAGSLFLLFYRWSSLKAETKMKSWLSREGLFLINNFLFLIILFISFWLSVLYPILSEIFANARVSIGPELFEKLTGPFWLSILILMGIAPMSAWRASTAKSLGRNIWKPAAASLPILILLPIFGVTNIPGILTFWSVLFVIFVTIYEFYRGTKAKVRTSRMNAFSAFNQLVSRNRRRYGGYIIHIGAVLISLGIIGLEAFQSQTQATLSLGEEMALGEYTARFDDLNIYYTVDGTNMQVAEATLTVAKDGKEVDIIVPRVDYYLESGQPMTIPGVRSTMEDDFYAILVDWEEISTNSATFKIYHNPLVNWLWIGSIVFILGTFVAAWPTKEESGY